MTGVACTRAAVARCAGARLTTSVPASATASAIAAPTAATRKRRARSAAPARSPVPPPCEQRTPRNRHGPADHERPEQRHRGKAERGEAGERDRLRTERDHQRKAAAERGQAKQRAQDPEPALGKRRRDERLARAHPERAVGGDERRQHRYRRRASAIFRASTTRLARMWVALDQPTISRE
jgi:hypothetical protein